MGKWPLSSLPSLDKITQGEFSHFFEIPHDNVKILKQHREQLLTEIKLK